MTKEELRQEFTFKTGIEAVTFIHGYELSPLYTIYLEKKVLELMMGIEYFKDHNYE